jgi:hypothetical protein
VDYCGFRFAGQFRPVCWTGYLCAVVCGVTVTLFLE